MSSLRTWAGRLGILAVILLSPIFGSLMLIAAEILIDLLMEAGAVPVLSFVTAGAGWFLFRKLSLRGRGSPKDETDDPPPRSALVGI
jgi:hypothetical protein